MSINALEVSRMLVADKENNIPVTRTDDIIHGNKWLNEALENINNYVTPEMFGAVGDGVTDDTEAIKEAIESIKSTGGTIEFSNGKTYVVDGTVCNMDNADFNIIVMGNNATLKQKAYVGERTMIYYNDKLTAYDLNVVGYISDNKSPYTESQQKYSFGFRSLNFSGECNFYRCTASNFGYDGWYHNSRNSALKLHNCKGYGNYRIDVTCVNGALSIDGGAFGDGSTPKRVASINIEPNENITVDYVNIKNAIVYGALSVWGGAGGTNIRNCELENVIIDNLYGDGALGVYRVAKTSIKNLIEKNSPKIQISSNSGQEIGATTWIGKSPKSANLITDDMSDWESKYNGGTVSDVDMGLYKGKRIQIAETGKSHIISKTVSVEPNTIYTMGAYMSGISFSGIKTGMFVTLGESVYNLKCVPNEDAKYVCREIHTGEDTTEITICIGSETTHIIDFSVAKPFLYKGRMDLNYLLEHDDKIQALSANKADVKNSVLMTKQTGTVFTLKNSAESVALIEYNKSVEGSEVKVSNKNIWEHQIRPEATSGTLRPVVNDDGSITLNGAVTQNTFIFYNIITNKDVINTPLESKQYVLSVTGGDPTGLRIDYRMSTDTGVRHVYLNNEIRTILIPNGAELIGFDMFVINGSSFDNVTIKVQLEEGEEPTEFVKPHSEIIVLSSSTTPWLVPLYSENTHIVSNAEISVISGDNASANNVLISMNEINSKCLKLEERIEALEVNN